MHIEIHITTKPLANHQLDEFIAFCQKIKAKPIVIELDEAHIKQQPMISKTVGVSDRSELNQIIESLKQAFLQNNYPITRVKLEVGFADIGPAKNLFPDYKGGYYEWHGQVTEQAVQLVIDLDRSKVVHVSKNALRGRPNARLITIRNPNNKSMLINHVKWLKRDLRNQDIKITKEHYEYCETSA